LDGVARHEGFGGGAARAGRAARVRAVGLGLSFGRHSFLLPIRFGRPNGCVPRLRSPWRPLSTTEIGRPSQRMILHLHSAFHGSLTPASVNLARGRNSVSSRFIAPSSFRLASVAAARL